MKLHNAFEITQANCKYDYRFNTVAKSYNRKNNCNFCIKLMLNDSRKHDKKLLYKMVFSSYVKQRILRFYEQGHRPPTISALLREEDINASRVGIAKFLTRFEQRGSISRASGSGRPSKINNEVMAIVEEKMREDDETTAYQLHRILTSKGYQISCRTILRCRTALGWTFRGSAYCQLIREPNKEKRLNWARKHLNDNFDNVVWTDECSVQLESHKRFCCRKQGEPPRLKPRYY